MNPHNKRCATHYGGSCNCYTFPETKAALAQAEARTSEIILRIPSSLKSRAVRLASANNRTLFVWVCEAITEKAEREERRPSSAQDGQR